MTEENVLVLEVIGYISLNEDGTPYRQVKSAGRWFQRNEPIKVYRTEKNAINYSPAGKCKPVYAEKHG